MNELLKKIFLYFQNILHNHPLNNKDPGYPLNLQQNTLQHRAVIKALNLPKNPEPPLG